MLNKIIFSPESLWLMVQRRWYVVVFLIAYLGIASYHWGFKRTLKFLVIGYGVAWISEASSIRNGFPYGFWQYQYDALRGEPMIFGVPFWDSLSYPFLCFSGYMLALLTRKHWMPDVSLQKHQSSWRTVLLGAFFTMILDVVIDPIAHLGDQWFLGKIYEYDDPGFYFDVPLSNFGGWFLVSLTILSLFRLTDRLENVPKRHSSVLLGVALFWGIYFFNLAMTLYVQNYLLCIASISWGLFLWLALSLQKKSERVPLFE